MTLTPGQILLGAKVAGLVALLTIAHVTGCNRGKASQQAETAKVQAKLDAANVSLTAAGKALKAVNDEAAKRIKQAEKDKALAEDAAKVAQKAQERTEREARAYADRLAKARRKPDCAALLAMDVEATCGL